MCRFSVTNNFKALDDHGNTCIVPQILHSCRYDACVVDKFFLGCGLFIRYLYVYRFVLFVTYVLITAMYFTSNYAVWKYLMTLVSLMCVFALIRDYKIMYPAPGAFINYTYTTYFLTKWSTENMVTHKTFTKSIRFSPVYRV